MIKVITYGTFDLLHRGHIRLLERARALGDYLVVGVTSDDYDKTRGKINVRQSLMERIEAVRATGLADEIIIEEYEGQKIDDIRRYEIDIFTVGSDWFGQFDYLNDYCKVIYLERTEGVSSSDIRAEQRKIRLGCVGAALLVDKFAHESKYVNGLEISDVSLRNDMDKQELERFLSASDAVYIASLPKYHYEHVKTALQADKHVLCESPMALSVAQYKELLEIAADRNCILMDSCKTAFSTAYARLLLLIKAGKIGDVFAVDATCTSIREMNEDTWNSICAWGPTAMLPVFDILGTAYLNKTIYTHFDEDGNDLFTKIDFCYPHAVASIKVGKGVKSEGELIVSGTKGYVYVPAPWWKTDYFEVRYENPADNKRYYYQLEGEGIRYELLAFKKTIENQKKNFCMAERNSEAFCKVIEDFYADKLIKI